MIDFKSVKILIFIIAIMLIVLGLWTAIDSIKIPNEYQLKIACNVGDLICVAEIDEDDNSGECIRECYSDHGNEAWVLTEGNYRVFCNINHYHDVELNQNVSISFV